jgi:hypothetical protein
LKLADESLGATLVPQGLVPALEVQRRFLEGEGSQRLLAGNDRVLRSLARATTERGSQEVVSQDRGRWFGGVGDEA